MDESTKISVRRRESRLRTDLPAQLVTLDGTPRVGLCDLSCRGARLYSARELRGGSQAVLSWLDFEAFGTIVWSSGYYAGMEFDEPLADSTVLKTRAKIDGGQALNTRQANYKAAHEWYLNLRH